MVLLPGSEGRRDPERAAAAQRQRERFARDVGDEAGLAWAHEPRRGPRKFTVGTFVVLILFAGLGALPLLQHGGDGSLLRADCTRPAVEASPERLRAGESFAWQAAGPATDSYVIAIDAAAVTVDAAGTARVSGGRVLAGPTSLPGCRSAQALAVVPDGRGTHEVAVFRRTGDRWERSAVALLRVS
jgi:hypothetical protein